MGIIQAIKDVKRHLEEGNQISDFISVIRDETAKNGMTILGEITQSPSDAVDKQLCVVCFLFDYLGKLYTAKIEYLAVRHQWILQHLHNEQYGFFSNYWDIGKNAAEVVSTLKTACYYLSIGRFNAYNTFSINQRLKNRVCTIGLGLYDSTGVYYLYKEEIDRLGIPEELFFPPSNSIEAFQLNNNIITTEEYEGKVHPIRVGNNKELALKILLTIRGSYHD